MEILKNRVNKYIITYYAILLLIMAFRTSQSAPDAIARLGYIAAFYIPIILKYTSLYLPCLVTFMTICTYNYAFGYLPYEMSTYFLLSLISFVFVLGTERSRSISIHPLFFILAFYVCVINILDSGEPQDLF